MVGFLNSLLEKGLSDSDIRILIYANFDSEKFQNIAKSLDYWCREWKGKRFPTPLRIVYCLDNLKMIALPFFDTAIDQSKIWGIEVDNLIIYKKAFPQVSLFETSGLLRKCSYDTYQNWPGEGDPKYGIRLPTVEEIHGITMKYQDIKGTISFLRQYGIEFDDWTCSSYWVQSLEPPYPMSISVIEEDYRTFLRLPATDTKTCIVRPILSLFEEKKEEGLDFVGTLDKYGLPDKKSEKFAKKLR